MSVLHDITDHNQADNVISLSDARQRADDDEVIRLALRNRILYATLHDFSDSCVAALRARHAGASIETAIKVGASVGEGLAVERAFSDGRA